MKNTDVMLTQIEWIAKLAETHKNILSIDINMSQDLGEHVGHPDSAHIKKGITDTLIYESYRNNDPAFQTNQMCEGESFDVPLYNLSSVEDQIATIEKQINGQTTDVDIKSCIFKIGAVYRMERCSSNWRGCAYLIKL